MKNDKIEIGDGLMLDVPTLLKTRLLIQANSGGGKSWLMRRIAEQLSRNNYQVIIIDPEGEFSTLREKYPFVLVGDGGETPADVRSAGLVARRLLELGASAVCDLYEPFRADRIGRREWVARFLESLVDSPKELWKPLVVMVDEAQLLCPQEKPKSFDKRERKAISDCSDAMIALNTVGRKRGFGSIWGTQRLAKVDKDASAEMLNRIVGMTFEDVDVDRAVSLLSVSNEDKKAFKKEIKLLDPGKFYCLGRAICKDRKLIKAGPVDTTHPEVGGPVRTEKPPLPAQIEKLLPKLADLPKAAEEKLQTEKQYKQTIAQLKTELTAAKRAQPAPAPKVETKIKTERMMDVNERKRLTALVDHYDSIEAGQKRVEALLVDAKSAMLAQRAEVTFIRALLADRIKPMPVSPVRLTAPPNRVLIVAPPKLKPREVIQLDAAPPNGAVELKGGEIRVMSAVAQYPDGVSRETLKTLTRYRATSVYEYSRSLVAKGCAENRNDTLYPTQVGIAALGDKYEALPTGEKLIDHWRRELSGGELKIFTFVVESRPTPVSREQIMEATTFKETSVYEYTRMLKSRRVLIDSEQRDYKGCVELAAEFAE